MKRLEIEYISLKKIETKTAHKGSGEVRTPY